MRGIRPHLWYDTQAVEAATFYTSAFDDSRISDVTTVHGTPSGSVDVVSFALHGQPFQAISAGPLFTFNPSVSFLVRCTDPDEVDAFWSALSQGGEALMPLDSYPFSKRYGWTQDRYGLSWQIMLTEENEGPRVIPMLLFVGEVGGKAEEAIDHYTSVFDNAARGEVQRWGKDEAPEQEGTIKFARFVLEGQDFAAMDSALGHDFAFNEAISFQVLCDTQAEIDHHWEALSAVPEAEQCGWLKDRYGLSWQIVPSALDRMMTEGTQEQRARATEAFLAMKKFDLAELERAYEGS